jgi:hypothetical protein
MRSLAFFLVGALVAQSPQVDVAKLLGSGRNDLWVFGVDRDVNDGSVLVQLRSWKVPPESWGATGAISAPGVFLHSERPREWDWKHRPAQQISAVADPIHLCKYDERSAFSPDWGPTYTSDGHHFSTGAILRFEEGHLRLIANGLQQARLDYGLTEPQNFVGLVGNKVFFFDQEKSDRIFFFEKGHPEQKFEVIVPTRPVWTQSWKVAQVVQVFEGNKPDEILVYVWVKNTAWISTKPRRDSSGVFVDLNTAKHVSSGIK